MAKIHPAIAGRVMEENEKLRGLLREAIHCCPDEQLRNEMKAALSQQTEPLEPALATVPDSSDAFYAGLYKKSAPMWHRLHDLAVSKGYDHVRFAIECAPVYKCDCMGARKMAIDMEGNTIPCECVAAANEAEPAPAQDGRTGYACHQCRAETPAPEPYKLYVVCQACGASTAATAAQALARPVQAEQQPVAVLDGWKLVPSRPDIEMVEAGYESSLGQPDRSGHARVIEMYEAMLNAAPQPEMSGLLEALERVKLTEKEARHHSVSAVAYWNNAVTACIAALSAQGGE